MRFRALGIVLILGGLAGVFMGESQWVQTIGNGAVLVGFVAFIVGRFMD